MTLPAIPTRRTAAAVAPAMPAPGRNMLPMQVGTATRLTPGEEEGLAALGWNKGDPVPANLAEVIASVQEEAASAQLPAGTPSLDPSAYEVKELSLDQLPQAYKELLANEMRKMADSASNQRKVLPDAGPGVNQAISDLQQRAANAAKAAVTSAYTPSQQSPPLPQQQAAPRPVPASVPTPAPTPTPATAAAPPPVEAAEPSISATPRYCPHCEKDIKADAVPNPSDLLKRRYIAATLSDSGCFRDTVELLDGAIVIGFRAMTHEESSACRDQIFKDVAAGKYSSQVELEYTLNEYRAICSTDFIRIAGRGEMSVPHLSELDSKQPFETIMTGIAAALRDEWLVRHWKLAFRKFDALCDKLFANMGNSDFWKPIG